MTSSTPRDLNNADLLAFVERMQREHRAEIGTLTDTVHHLQEKMRALDIRTPHANAVHAMPVPEMTSRRTAPRSPLGNRGRRLGMGISLAFLLLIAPSQSGKTYAYYEGLNNTAFGRNSLPTTTGIYNSAFGANTLPANTGDYNTASGSYALSSNSSGNYNTASGAYTLNHNTVGNDNTAIGMSALQNNVSGAFNTASGATALLGNTSGSNNTASGYSALVTNSTGSSNTAFGHFALASNTTGVNNTAVGYQSGYTDSNTNANSTGSNNTFIGYNSGPGTSSQLTNATAIGANAVVSQDNSIVLGGTGANTQKVGVGTETPHSAFQIAKGFLQLRPITGAPAAAQCQTADDAGRLVVRTDGNINLYVCTGTGGWIGK